MRYKLINVEGDNLYGGSVVYQDDDVEAAKHLNHYKASDDGIGYYHHPGVRRRRSGVRSSFYIAEIHPLFNASTAGSLGYDKFEDLYDKHYIVNDIILKQLRGYTK